MYRSALAAFLAVVSIVSLTWCTTPSSTTYADGPMVRPPPVRPVPGYTPPGTGLPEYFVPPQRRLPPEPRPVRVLPETPESRKQSGVWASKAPGSDPTLEIFGERIPAPEDAKARSLTLWCIGHAANEFGKEAFKGKTPEWKRCAGATVISVCLEAERKRLKGKVDVNSARHYEPARMGTARAAHARMEALKALLCDGHSDQDTVGAEAAMQRRISGIPWGAP